MLWRILEKWRASKGVKNGRRFSVTSPSIILDELPSYCNGSGEPVGNTTICDLPIGR